MSDQDQVVDRAGVGDDQLHRLEPQTLQVLKFASEFLDRVVYPHAMGLEEPVELITGCNTRKAAESGLSDVPGLIFLQTECLQCPARQVAAGGAELAGKIVRNFNRQVPVGLQSV